MDSLNACRTTPIQSLQFSTVRTIHRIHLFFKSIQTTCGVMNRTTPEPRFILTPSHVSHIQAAIICATEQDMQIKTPCEYDDCEGISYWSENPNHFILDLFNFHSINVSIRDESAWVEAGATLGDLHRYIAEKSSIHAFPAGVSPTVVIGSHFCGGGNGNMMRKYGLSVDIIDAKIIDVNGRLLDRESMGEDHFWSVTGGSNSGVVLSYKIQLVRVPSKVTIATVTRTYDDNFIDLVHYYQQIAADKLSEDV